VTNRGEPSLTTKRLTFEGTPPAEPHGGLSGDPCGLSGLSGVSDDSFMRELPPVGRRCVDICLPSIGRVDLT